MSRWLRVAEENVNKKAKNLIENIIDAERYLEEEEDGSGFDADRRVECTQSINDCREELKELLPKVTDEEIKKDITETLAGNTLI